LIKTVRSSHHYVISDGVPTLKERNIVELARPCTAKLESHNHDKLQIMLERSYREKSTVIATAPKAHLFGGLALEERRVGGSEFKVHASATR
jgi:hypothetical protein